MIVSFAKISERGSVNRIEQAADCTVAKHKLRNAHVRTAKATAVYSAVISRIVSIVPV